MKHIFFAFVLIFVGAVGWRIGGSLSSDAMGMAIGMLFGIMAGIPTALLVLASARRQDDYDRGQCRQEPRQIEQQPPAQVINNHYHYHAAPSPQRDRRAEVEARHELTGSAPETRAQRQFRIIGEIEDKKA